MNIFNQTFIPNIFVPTNHFIVCIHWRFFFQPYMCGVSIYFCTAYCCIIVCRKNLNVLLLHQLKAPLQWSTQRIECGHQVSECECCNLCNRNDGVGLWWCLYRSPCTHTASYFLHQNPVTPPNKVWMLNLKLFPNVDHFLLEMLGEQLNIM